MVDKPKKTFIKTFAENLMQLGKALMAFGLFFAFLVLILLLI